MKLSFLALPAVVTGHGIAIPMTDSIEEVHQAGTSAIKLVTEVVEKCGKEIVECLPATTQGWQAGARCLIEKFDSIEHDDCLDEIEHMARHLPAALFTHRATSQPNLESALGDIGKRTNQGCDVNRDNKPYVWSYHMHVQWDFECHECRQTAEEFFGKFLNQFQPDAEMCNRMAFLTDLWNTKSVSRTEYQNHHFADICKMATLPPGGPFFHSEKGFVLSTTMYHRVLPWLMANRPLNDELFMFIHPNTGCQYNDLKHWSMWVSPHSVKMFFPILTGCVWAACEDKVLGCIVWDHLRQDKGYGNCFLPPTEYEIDCKLILGDSNTSTEVCGKRLNKPALTV
jgi:aromatic ring-cleaving dioxygenase